MADVFSIILEYLTGIQNIMTRVEVVRPQLAVYKEKVEL